MSFIDEIAKLARTRRAYLRFAQEENPDRPWAGLTDRRYAKVDDAQSLVPLLGTVSRFGTIQRSLATFLTGLEVPNVSIELFDPDRQWRSLIGGPGQDADDFLTYRALSLWLRVLDDARAPLDQRVGVAHIRKVSFPSGGKVQFDCQVASGSFLGDKVPRRLITTEDWPDCPAEVRGLPVPVIYGRRHNNVNPFPVGGSHEEDEVDTRFHEGTPDVDPEEGTDPVAGDPANPDPTPECAPDHESGSPSGGAVRALLVGTYTPPGADVGVTPCGKPVFGTVEALAAALQASKDAGTLFSDGWPPCIGYADTQGVVDHVGPIPTDPAGMAALIGYADMNCLVYGECGHGGAQPLKNAYVLAGHALKAVNDVYVLKPVAIQNFSGSGDDSATRSDKVQVRMTEGVDYVQGWVDIHGNRYHGIAFMKAQVSETCEYYEVTANVEGIETVGDGSGTLLENADDIVEHAMLNWILNSYHSGNWATDVSYAPGIWDHSSVEKVKAIAAQRIPGGYKGGGTLDVVIEAREWLRELLISYDLELYFNNNSSPGHANGAWSLSRFDPNTPLDTIPIWDARVDSILKDSFSTDIAIDRMINVLPFFAGPTTERLDTSSQQQQRPEGGGWHISGEFKDDAPGGSIERYGIAKSDPIYLKWTDDPATAADVMAHYLRYQERPPIPASLRIGLQALQSPLGSLVRVTHPDGPGSAEGWVERICKVVRSDIDLDRLVVGAVVEDVDRLMYQDVTAAARQVEYFTFAKATATGEQTVPVGFRGKAMILWTEGQTAPGLFDRALLVMGMTDGVTQVCRSIDHPDAATPNTISAQCERTDCCFYFAQASTTAFNLPPLARATFGEWTDTGFTLNWTHNSDGVPALIHCLVIGGTEVSADLVTQKITVGSGGTIDVPVAFAPDAYIVMGGAADEFGAGDYANGRPFGSMHGFGFSNGVENICGWTLGVSDQADHTYCARGQHTDRAFSIRLANFPGATDLCGGTISNLPTGFRITRIAGSTSHQPVEHVLCLKGLRFFQGAFTTPGAPGSQVFTLPFAAQALILQTHGLNTATGTGLGLAMGAWKSNAFGTRQGGIWVGGQDSVSPSVFARATYTDAILRSFTPAATGTASPLACHIVASADPAGVKLTYVAVPGSPIQILGMAIGPPV